MRLIGAVIALALLVAACGSEAPSDVDAPSDAAAPDLRAGHVATLADLVGPWQREPFRLDANVLAAADGACRADTGFPPDVALVGIDARGGGRLIAAYAGPGGVTADCSYIEVAESGAIRGGLGGGMNVGMFAPLAPGQLEYPLGGGQFADDTTTVQYVIGRVGAGTARVVLEVEGIGSVTATLGNGWYLAWWEGGEPLDPTGPSGFHRLPGQRYTATAYDALGHVTDEIQP